MVVKGEVDPDDYVVFKPLLGQVGLCPIIDKRTGSKESKLVYGDPGSTRMMTTEEDRTSRLRPRRR